MIKPLSSEQIHRVCPTSVVEKPATETAAPLETIIGQERAVLALRFGLDIRSKGFNIYVAGLPGTGKTTAVKQFLEVVARSKPTPPDWCYVHDFENVERPNAIQLPPGKALQFKADLENLLHLAIPQKA